MNAPVIQSIVATLLWGLFLAGLIYAVTGCLRAVLARRCVNVDNFGECFHVVTHACLAVLCCTAALVAGFKFVWAVLGCLRYI